MIQRPWDTREIAGSNTASHCVVNIRTVMCSKVVPYKSPMKISARDIVSLNILAYVVAKVMENLDGGANGA